MLNENGRRRTSPEKSPGPDVDELAGPGTGRQRRCVERLEPLPRQDLPALDQLGRDEPHAHAVGLAVLVPSAPRLLGARRRVGSPSSSASAPPSLGVLDAACRLRRERPGTPRRGRRPGRRRRRSGRRTRRARPAPPSCPPLVLGCPRGRPRPGRRRRGRSVSRSSSSSTMIRSPIGRSAARRRPRTARAGAASRPLAALLEGEGEVVQPAGGLLLVVGGSASSAGRRPTSRPPPHTGPRRETTVSLGRDPGDLEQVALGGRLGAAARPPSRAASANAAKMSAGL